MFCETLLNLWEVPVLIFLFKEFKQNIKSFFIFGFSGNDQFRFILSMSENKGFPSTVDQSLLISTLNLRAARAVSGEVYHHSIQGYDSYIS
jgi:hypothetical protein